MGKAKQCDICGRFYTPYNMQRDPKNVNGFVLVNIDMSQKYFGFNPVDCCPECIAKIQNYIDELKENG